MFMWMLEENSLNHWTWPDWDNYNEKLDRG
jgi:hypothetical protein